LTRSGVLEIADAWYRHATSSDRTDEFDQFVYLWFALNALYGQYLQNDERAAIREMLDTERHHFLKPGLVNVLTGNSARFFARRIIRDARGNGRDTREHAITLCNPSRNNMRRLRAFLMILYQVRCNLFHGNKLYYRDSDKEVVRHASVALKEILSLYLTGN
jgi:hypothetical protein